MAEKKIEFPKNFVFGAATSAYQVEGGIENADWSKFFPADLACDHYHLFKEDIDILEKLNLNAFRFSLEWSRIEPEEGKFVQKEIDHYREVLLYLKKKRIKTFATLFHFTLPLWLAKKGGWENKKTIFYFSRFGEKIFQELGELVDFWITINEPLIYAGNSFFRGVWPPQKKSLISALRVVRNLISAHRKIYQVFHSLDKEVQLGIAKNNIYLKPFKEKIPDKISAKIYWYFWNNYFLNQIKKYQDFIGLNYYFAKQVHFEKNKWEFFPINPKEKRKFSDLGWEIYPPGIYYVLKDLIKYKKPIYITENGLADKKDILRKEFIQNHLFWIKKAIDEGVDVRGYLYWSLLDNLEWDAGFEPRFGLVEVDYKTLKRKIRNSAFYFAEIAKNNYLKIEN